MNPKSTATLLALAMIVVAVPSALADGSTSRSDTLTPFFATPSVSTAHQYEIELTADTSFDATLSWDDERTDLDLLFTDPGGTCDVLPEPDADCLVATTESRVEAATCQTESEGESIGLGPGSETISTAADGHDAGEATYSLWVLASTAVPLRSVSYDLTVTTGDDGHEDVDDGPQFTNLLRSSGHCRGL